MTNKPVSNVAASVRSRLLNLSQARGADYNPLLTQCAIERFLFRLSKSELVDRFVLKSAMLFRVWAAEIREEQEYGGIRIKLVAMLGNARIPMQVDVGFGDCRSRTRR